MLYPAFLILFAAGGAVGEEDCRQEVFNKCNITNFPTKIPDTMEDLNRNCRFALDGIKCIQEEKECNIEYFNSEEVRKATQFMETNCDESSSVYQGLSRNYECIKNLAMNVAFQCRHFTQIDDEAMANLISKAGELPETAKRCKYSFFEIICLGHIVGVKCGQEAKEVTNEILLNTKLEFQDCNVESILTDLQPLKEIFETTLTEAYDVENDMLREIKAASAE